ncbi:uncharacterized protein DUF4169 [Pseudaminobacter salicylatoxidans]|uniref:Uncharacterized protein DUF4169 n=1 Tax=Pseudaminobacter salicylatoxidans TaxID=93369 RepID=A0A316C2V6_PSESE|nr:uncharacterized protein DUF4169 [Pseudaminobacter salicylatoxidans]
MALADIVNLRQFRKQKACADKEREAEQSRALHGRSKAEKQRDRKQAEQASRFIEGHKREKNDDPAPSQEGAPR